MKKLLLTFLPLFTLTAEASIDEYGATQYLVIIIIVIVALVVISISSSYDSEQDQKESVAERDRAKAEAKAIAEAKAKAKAEAKAKAKAEDIIEEQRLAKEKLDADLIKLHNSLPFYTSNSSDEFSDTNGDNSRWHYVVEAVKKCDTTETTLYFVKVKSLNDDDEYYKIGVTTHSIASRFLKSTDAELLEVIASHKMEKRLALFAEFHFIREFRPDDEPNESKSFSGYTEVVKKNSIKKITSLFSTLPEYEAKASSFLKQALTDES